MRVADEVQGQLEIGSTIAGLEHDWVIDTFACQDDAALRSAAARLEADEAGQARRVLDERADSVWLADPQRRLVWRALERCIDFSTSASAVVSELPGAGAGLAAWFNAYCSDDGLWRLDRLQRFVEQTYAECINAQPLDAAVDACRAKYREAVERMQDGFLHAVAKDGWPPPDVARATQCYKRAVAPGIERKDRVAYFLVDALRYEMARDLDRDRRIGRGRPIAGRRVSADDDPCRNGGFDAGSRWLIAARRRGGRRGTGDRESCTPGLCGAHGVLADPAWRSLRRGHAL